MEGERALKKYDPLKVEEEVMEYWAENKIYEKVVEKNRDKPKYYFLDGPPYPSSESPHPGTCWNKVLKDFFARYRWFKGFNVRTQPGWDCHGLPIEVAVEKMLGLTSKAEVEKMGVKEFIDKCRELALKNVKAMTERFRDLGVFMDWENPYMTLTNEYIECTWHAIKKAYEKGLLEEGLKVVHWCTRCGTVLADYEVTEYKDLTDPSIYVKFRVKGKENEYILIWTTTPWTLPSNEAVMVHPDYTYVRAEANGEVYILAKERLEAVSEETGVKFKVLEEFKGRDIEGLEYVPPLLEEVPEQGKLKGVHKVILSEKYVTLEEGTGCVHAAPGHGEEDFEECYINRGMPVFMPVDDKGVFKEEAGKYTGLYVKKADKIIIEDLERKRLLLYKGQVTHKYPVCWRCKTPLILRATKQWYIRIRELKDKLIEKSMGVKWQPEWGRTRRFRLWLEGLRDWVISRQRYWGTPLPIWRCENCGHWTVIGSLKELKEKAIDKVEIKDLHKPYVDRILIKCDKCGGKARRVPDVIDVWMDSGVSFYASLTYPLNEENFKYWWPVDFITEGHDQIAGWFFSLLKVGLIVFDECPYRSVLMHGFMLDEKGNPMSKSRGNFIPPEQIVSKHGRDAFRLFLMLKVPWEDNKFIWRDIHEAFRMLNVIWNVYKFLDSTMELLKPSSLSLDAVEGEMLEEDKWVLSKLNSLVQFVENRIENLYPHEATREIYKFIVEDLSRFYVRLVKKRIWEEELNATAGLVVLFNVLKEMNVLMTLVTPFISEKIYRSVISKYIDGKESVQLEDWPKVESKWIDKELEEEVAVCREIIAAILAARSKAGIKLRQPLREVIIKAKNDLVARAVKKLERIVKWETNVGKVVLGEVGEGKYSVVETNTATIYLNIEIGPEERKEGIAREVIRRIQVIRRELGLKRGVAKVVVYIVSRGDVKKAIEEKREEIARATGAVEIRVEEEIAEKDAEAKWKEWEIYGEKIEIGVKEIR